VPVWRKVEMARLWPFLLGALAGVPLGAAVVRHAPTGPIKSALLDERRFRKALAALIALSGLFLVIV